MKVICAWCGTLIREGDDSLVSHGMCASCRHNPEMLHGKPLENFADAFPFPVVITDGSIRPVAINRSAYENLTNHQKITDYSTMGIMVECRHSREPGGCGKTVHCTGCVLRDTIAKTNETGEPFTDVPAKLNSAAEEVFYYVSTRKVDNHVLVKMVKAEK